MVDSTGGITSININQMVTLLAKSYTSLIETGTQLKAFPPVMLWGPPGVGKSQGVREIAALLRKRTKKRVEITDVRLLLFNPVDLRGIPTANEDKTLAVWLKPKIFQMDDSPDVINILFLDEISAAPQSVQAAAYQITLDRTVGEHKLPDNCIVMAAGNRVTDKSVAYNMPKALANRLCHLEIKGDPDAWHDWAVSHSLHPYVVGYLEYNPVALMRFDPSSTDLAFPTPRAWEMVSNILNTVSDNMDLVYPLVIGCIGHNAAHALLSWSELYTSMPPVEDIFLGKDVALPKAPELLIVLRSAMVSYARSHPTQDGIDRSIDFACKLPWSFRGRLLHDYYHTPNLRPLVETNGIFQTARKKGLQ